MLTAGVAMVSGGQGNPLLLPATSGEGQRALNDGLFAKNMDELIASSAEAKAQLSAEQVKAGTEKSDVLSADDLTKAGSESLETGKISMTSGFQCMGAAHASVASSGTDTRAIPMTSELDRSGKEDPTVTLVQSDIEKDIASKSPVEDTNELKKSIASSVRPRQSPLELVASQAGTITPQPTRNISVIPKEAAATGEHKAERRETKKQTSEMSLEGDMKTGASLLDGSASQPTIAMAMVSPINIEVPTVAKVETSATLTKNSPGPVSYKANSKAATGFAVSDSKDRAQHGKGMIVSAGIEETTGLQGTAGHSQSSELDTSKKSSSSLFGSGEIPVKSSDAVAVAPTAMVSVPIVHGVRKFSNEVGNDTAGVAIGGSQGTLSQDTWPVNEGHRLLSATPTSLEVGIANGGHGWMKIRAELTEGGAVNASVSAASSAGQEMLHRELPSLTVYLQSERLCVNEVVVHAAAMTSEARDFSETMSSGAQNGQTQHGNQAQGGDGREGLTAHADGADELGPFVGVEGADAGVVSSITGYREGGSGGGWLSVMA